MKIISLSFFCQLREAQNGWLVYATSPRFIAVYGCSGVGRLVAARGVCRNNTYEWNVGTYSQIGWMN